MSISVLVVEAFKRPYSRQIPNSEIAIQKIIGENIFVYPAGDSVVFLCNEGGEEVNTLSLNRALRDSQGVYDIILGTFIICGLVGGNFTSLSPRQNIDYRALFKRPDLFCMSNGAIVIV